jgi:hypothetical protein
VTEVEGHDVGAFRRELERVAAALPAAAAGDEGDLALDSSCHL